MSLTVTCWSCGFDGSNESTAYARAEISVASPSRLRSRPSTRATGSAERKKKIGARRKYYLEIITPGALVGLIVGYAAYRYQS